MRILAVNASHRGHRGHTGFLIDRIFAGARAGGAECEEATLSSLRVEPCRACDRCQRKDLAAGCVLDGRDDVPQLFARLAAADLVIWATPVYIFGLSSRLQAVLERFYAHGDPNELRVSRAGLVFHDVDHALCEKPFVSLICCDNIEPEMTRSARNYFRTFSRFMDAPLVGELVRDEGRLCGHGHPAQASDRLVRVWAAFEEAGRELAARGRVRRSTERRASAEVVPVPLFRWLKRIRVVALKQKMLERARATKDAATSPGP